MELAEADRRRARETIPSTCHDLTLLGTDLLYARDLAKAEDALKQALRLDCTSLWAHFVLGHCHFARGRFLEAAGDFDACAVGNPSFAWIHFNRGLALARAGRSLDARHAYDRALELDPNFAEALVNRAIVELELDQPSSAQRDLLEARKLGREDLAALAALGESWARMGRQADAERYLGALLEMNPNSVVVRVARGFTRIATDPEGARRDFGQALDHDPRHAHALYGMALLARSTDLQRALELLNGALRSDPYLIDALQLRALVRARLGERAAVDDVERLVQSPTAHHLYNAACALAVYSEKVHDGRLVPHALELLARALELGISPADAAADPDLNLLHRSPEFERLIAQTRYK
jgi:tetratricopeptide (TPR) repeat protein